MQLSNSALSRSPFDKAAPSFHDFSSDLDSSLCSGSDKVVFPLEPAPHDIVSSSDESQDPDDVYQVSDHDSLDESDGSEPSDDPHDEDNSDDADDPDSSDSDHSDVSSKQ